MSVLLPILIAAAPVVAFLVWFCQPTLRVTHTSLPIVDLPPELEGFKIVQLSDIHYDLPKKQSMTAELLEEIIQTTNALAPDMICLTGDYVNRDPVPAAALSARLGNLRSKYGSFAILGNHDHDGNGQVVETHLRSANITVLTNSCVSLPSLPLTVVGFDDLWHRRFRPDIAKPLLDQAMQGKSGKQVVIGMSHNPDTADALKEWPFEVLLSGHTHGGQVVIPFFNVPLLRLFKVVLRLPRTIRSYIPGEHHFHSVKDWSRASGLFPLRRADGSHMRLYVSRGLGSHGIKNFRLRIFCDPEIAVFTLTRAE